MYYLDENIENLERIFDQNSREGYLRLDLNENPGGIPEEFIKKVLGGVSSELVSKYPETLEFTQTLADFHNTDIEHICLVNGSAEGIRYVIEAFTSVGGKVVGVVPTYAMYEVYCKMYGREFIPVKYDDELKMNVQTILDTLDESVQLLILVNPNNPVGNVYSEGEMRSIIERAQEKQITILIDEAYMYFYPLSFVEYALTQEHIFVTRTFSKIFSMAGCRLGYVLGWPMGIKMVQKLCTPHNVNAFSMLLAQSILKEEGMLQSLIDIHNKGKNYLTCKLQENGYQYSAKEGNFVFIKPKTDSDTVVRRMKEEKRILIKKYRGVGELGDCLRVTTGAQKYMEQFVEALVELEDK